jgi:hypothetical protein
VSWDEQYWCREDPGIGYSTACEQALCFEGLRRLRRDRRSDAPTLRKLYEADPARCNSPGAMKKSTSCATPPDTEEHHQ